MVNVKINHDSITTGHAVYDMVLTDFFENDPSKFVMENIGSYGLAFKMTRIPKTEKVF